MKNSILFRLAPLGEPSELFWAGNARFYNAILRFLRVHSIHFLLSDQKNSQSSKLNEQIFVFLFFIRMHCLRKIEKIVRFNCATLAQIILKAAGFCTKCRKSDISPVEKRKNPQALRILAVWQWFVSSRTVFFYNDRFFCDLRVSQSFSFSSPALS